MTRTIEAEPMSADAFAEFGDLIDLDGGPDWMINDGLCGRHHDKAKLDFSDGRPGISLFDAEPRRLPYTFQLVERHPDGSQAFLPMTQHPFLVVVAPDAGGTPATPRAFLTEPGQGVNLHRGTWHGVLTPLYAPGRFAVVDRIGPGPNLEEFRFDEPFTVIAKEPA